MSQPASQPAFATVKPSNGTNEEGETAGKGNPKTGVDMSTEMQLDQEPENAERGDQSSFHVTNDTSQDLQAGCDLVSESQFTKRQSGREDKPRKKQRAADDRLHPRASPCLSTDDDLHHTKTDEDLSAREPLWMPNSTFARIQWDENIISDVYTSGLGGGTSIPCTRRIQILDGNSYLEKVLWPNFDAREASVVHVLSIIIMANEKFREK